MKQKLQHLFIIFFMMSLALCAKAEQKTVTLTEPGTISQYIPESEKNQITDLTVKGDLNGTDVRFLREMAGVDIYGQPVSGSLVRLDLTDANIVEGGDFFFVDESMSLAYYTSNNVIGSNFMCNSKLQECLLPKSVKAIKGYAFANSKLKTLTLPEGLELIEIAAFQNASITGVTLPKSLKTISKNAFLGCKDLSSVSYANGVEVSNLKTIGNTAFGLCDNLKDFQFPSSIETIGNSAFCYCTGLEHVVIPKNLKNLGEAAFYGCTSLSDFELLAPVDFIQDRLLYDCISLKTVKIPEGVKSINQSAFTGCKNLKSIYFPESLEFIDDFAFAQTGLETIIIPKNVKELKRNIINAGVGVTVYSMSPVPPMAISGDYSTFGESTGVLYVPTGCKAAYMAADGWKEFKEVDEFDPAGVASVETDGNNGVAAVYTIGGSRIDGVQRGMNIVKGKDGRVHKVVVRQ